MLNRPIHRNRHRKIATNTPTLTFAGEIASFQRTLSAALISAVLLVTSTVRAAEQADDNDPTETASLKGPAEPADGPIAGPQSTTSAGSPRRAENKNEKNGDIFTPSEEISEDFAVSFPVDI